MNQIFLIADGLTHAPVCNSSSLRAAYLPVRMYAGQIVRAWATCHTPCLYLALLR